MLKDEELLWQAVQHRDASQDGAFFYGVATTGVYCKPSCGSRRPLRKNVLFYSSAQQAEQGGLRACKRCKPRDVLLSDAVDKAIRQVCLSLKENPLHAPDSATLAACAGMSISHFQRTFKRIVGVTPKQYGLSLRMQTLKQDLKAGLAVTESIYANGFSSGSRVYERSNGHLGMTPAQYKKGAQGITISYASAPSQLGRMMMAATDRGLCFLQFGDTHLGLLALLEKEYPHANRVPVVKPYHQDFQRWLDALDAYMVGAQPSLALPLDVQATAFQLRVWNYLQSIPYGEVRSYRQVAQDVGAPAAIRAVASACARNRVAVLVPCHRVLRSNGSLGGYRWGLDRKQTLLDLERSSKSQ